MAVGNDRVRTNPSGRGPALVAVDSDAGGVRESHLKAIDLIGEKARLNELIAGSRGPGSPLFSKIQKTMVNLEWLSRAGSPMEDRRGYELWGELASIATDAVLKKMSVAGAMSPVLMSRSALEAYFSLAGALERCLFDDLLASYSRSIETARFELGTDMPMTEKVRQRVLSYCITTYMDMPSELFQAQFSDRLKDPAFVYAHDVIERAKKDLDKIFRAGLSRFEAFQADFADFIDMLYEADEGASAESHEMWRYAFSEVGDLVRDAHNVLTSLDVTLYRLERYRTRAPLGEALELLTNFDASHVHSIIDLAMGVLNARATARNTAIHYELTPGIEVPSYLKVDLFRAVFEPMLNAVSQSDLSASDRKLTVKAYMRVNLLQVKIKDSNTGLAGLGTLVMADERGGLARMTRIARRRGWRISAKSRKGEGAAITLSIDTKGWSSELPSATGTRPTLTGYDYDRMPSFGGVIHGSFGDSGEERVDSVMHASMFASMAYAARGSLKSFPPPVCGVFPPLPVLL